MKYRNTIVGLLGILVAGCAGPAIQPKNDWVAMYGDVPTTTPVSLLYGLGDVSSLYGDVPVDNDTVAPVAQPTPVAVDATNHRMAVLLPLTGDAAATGREIADAVQLAVLLRKMKNLDVSFYDTGTNRDVAIADAVASTPEVIVGPLFADDVRALRRIKPADMPALSFTSDASAVGDGVMTMALMPTNSIEAIVSEIATDNARGVLILAPNTDAGRQMAGVAERVAKSRELNIAGIYFYTQNDTDSMKTTAMAASVNESREAANTAARRILSDILTNEQLTVTEKSSLDAQLEKITKAEVIGELPYNAVLFLGTGDDTQTLASFMRYYGVGARDARFYGTAMWDGADVLRDPAMMGAKYAALPEMSSAYVELYTNVTGRAPSRLASFGYDAANLAMGMFGDDAAPMRYLMSPSGYTGLDGLVRLTPRGASERALAIMQIRGGGVVMPVRTPATDFITPIYSVDVSRVDVAREMPLATPDINPMDYINIPVRLINKYRKVKQSGDASSEINESIITVPDDDSPVITSQEFEASTPERVKRTLIDAVEING